VGSVLLDEVASLLYRGSYPSLHFLTETEVALIIIILGILSLGVEYRLFTSQTQFYTFMQAYLLLVLVEYFVCGAGNAVEIVFRILNVAVLVRREGSLIPLYENLLLAFLFLGLPNTCHP